MDRIAGTVPLFIADAEVGCVTEAWHDRTIEVPGPLEPHGDGLRLRPSLDTFDARCTALADWAMRLRERGWLPGWRDERVRIDDAHGHALALVERALLRPLGLLLHSVQACVWTTTTDGPRIWVARRAWHKPVDPGRLDALVAGGIAGFDDAHATLVRECAEEAGLPESLARLAQQAGVLELCHGAMDDGLPVVHRERVALHELEIPPQIVPIAADGEHEAILSMTPAEALASIEADPWTRDGAQATRDLVMRHGWVASAPSPG
ncbi:MAG: DUF4743 domain-containing protein [Burkholderiaceae bacterium]|jgi:8-oxo-dGTP pyrophosphatase MutT (NUDIX family)